MVELLVDLMDDWTVDYLASLMVDSMVETRALRKVEWMVLKMVE